jgi:hypothetical protein
MRAMMGLIKDRHGTYYAQRRVPDRLQEAVARVLNSEKPKQVFLKKSLGTKVLKTANVAATHVLADFDRTLASAEALLKERPSVSLITDAQIRRMAESYYASVLHGDEEERQEGTGSESLFQSIAQQLTSAGVEFKTPFKVEETPEAGLSDRKAGRRLKTKTSERVVPVHPQLVAVGFLDYPRKRYASACPMREFTLGRSG